MEKFEIFRLLNGIYLTQQQLDLIKQNCESEVFEQNPDIKEKIEKASDTLVDIYQMCAEILAKQ